MASINTTRARRPSLPPQGGVPPARFEPSNTQRTHEGAPAAWISPELQLRRSVCSCLLWEDTFYEDGKAIGDRIADLAGQVVPKIVADLAVDARSHLHLRHVPLLLCAVLARTGRGTSLVRETLAETIQRPDELGEFLAVYAKVNGVKPSALKPKLSNQVRKGISAAFAKFDRHQLAKYLTGTEGDAAVRGRDAMFLAHAKPRDEEMRELFGRIARKQPVVTGGADTWEVALSTGPAEGTTKAEHKRATFERLLRDGGLGYLALLRNLRNMTEAGVEPRLIRDAIVARRGARRVLPFRYLAAARACPQMTDALDQALSEAISAMPEFGGRTTVLVDVSGSMDVKLSGKSDLTRMDAAAALASMIHGNVSVFTFSQGLIMVSPRPVGIAGIAQILRSQPHGDTYLGGALTALRGNVMDRLIVITDEQVHDHVGDPPTERAYMINVAPHRNGVGYGERWLHIDGFSEQVLRFMHEFEALRETVGSA